MRYLSRIASWVSPYEPADKVALREFQREYFGPVSRQADDAFQEWLYERNPHREPGTPALWVCKRDGVVLGQQGCIPVRLKVGDREHTASWVIDWMVRRDWRLRGVGPALFAAYSACTEIMLGLVVEDAAYRSFVKAGWLDVGTLSLFVRPLDPRACAAGFNAPQLLTRLAPRALFRNSARAMARLARVLKRASLETIPAFDERVEAVWTTASREYRVLVKRDFASLRWRFDETPHRLLYDRYYLRHGERVVGYVVTRLESWHGHIAARVVDYLTERRWHAPLLALAIDELRRRGAVAVFVERLHADSERVLWSLGCVRVRPSDRFMLNAQGQASHLRPTLADARNWLVTTADSDFEHIVIQSRTG